MYACMYVCMHIYIYNLMNEQKRSELYSMEKSLNGKSGKQALGKKRKKKKKNRKQMLTDKNLLILTGRHSLFTY